ncbi:MAG TPA: hypothetical protein VNY05_10145 [Candidatus Acidoferrales bacterium]|jgi:hypothetical protein|nr:hypothetical protein [Candidatus Acidoferrales bacterium]
MQTAETDPTPALLKTVACRLSQARETALTLTAVDNFFAESLSLSKSSGASSSGSNTAWRYQKGKLEDRLGRVSQIGFDEATQLLAAAGLAPDRANLQAAGSPNVGVLTR